MSTNTPDEGHGSARRFGAVRRVANRPAVRRWVSIVVAVAVVAFVAIAVADSWGDVRSSLTQLSPFDIGAAFVTALVSVWAMYRGWLALLEGLHAAMPSHRARSMFFGSQLGKYVPGSVWPALIQSELGNRSNVPRRAVLTSYAFSLMASVGVGGLVTAGLFTHPSTGWVTLAVTGAIIGGVVTCAAFVHPRGSQRLWRRLLRERDENRRLAELPPSCTAKVLVWTFIGWIGLSLHAWLLARPLGAQASDLAFVGGAFALAWVAGLVALPLPAGAGLREAVLVVTLGPLIGEPAALSIALVSRLIMVIDDIVLALAAGLPAVLREIRPRKSV